MAELLKMKCPKCAAGMESVTFEGVTVDRCGACKGIWFDAGEQKQLTDKHAAEAVDIGDAGVGRRMDKIHDILCPRCAVPMMRMVAAESPAIDYEACPRCFGIFLDAGEFRQFKDSNVSEYLRGLLERRQKSS